jgi:hypothetical protein
MAYLKLKYKIKGNKYHSFKYLIILSSTKKLSAVPLNILGSLDNRPNKNLRYIIIDILMFFEMYSKGLEISSKNTTVLYYYFLGRKIKKNQTYFNKTSLKLILNNEIK